MAWNFFQYQTVGAVMVYGSSRHGRARIEVEKLWRWWTKSVAPLWHVWSSFQKQILSEALWVRSWFHSLWGFPFLDLLSIRWPMHESRIANSLASTSGMSSVSRFLDSTNPSQHARRTLSNILSVDRSPPASARSVICWERTDMGRWKIFFKALLWIRAKLSSTRIGARLSADAAVPTTQCFSQSI